MNFDVVFKEKDIELQADFGSKIELNHLIVQSMTEEKVYAISNSSVDAPTEWEDEAPIPTTDKPYLWMKTKTSCTTVDGTVYNFADNGIVVGTIGKDGSPGKDGKTPVKGVDYWTEEEQANIVAKVTQDVVTEEMIQQVISVLATPVFGRVDEYNNIIIAGNLVPGTYTLKYEGVDGIVSDIGIITVSGNQDPDAPNLQDEEWQDGYRLNSSGGLTYIPYNNATTHFIPCVAGDVVQIKGLNIANYNANETGGEGGVGRAILYYYADDKETQLFSHVPADTRDVFSNNGDTWTFTVGNGLTGDTTGIAYVRACGHYYDGYTKDNVVITVNQETI